jgi:hypothetical protein
MTRDRILGEIPSSYIEFSSSDVFGAGDYPSVHAHQNFRLNHNALLAERARRPVMTGLAIRSTGTVQTPFYGFQDEDPLLLPVLFETPIVISQQTRELEFVIRASTTSSTTFTLYPSVAPLTAGPRETDIDTSIAVTATSETKYTATVPIREAIQPRRYGMIHALFRVSYRTTIDFSTPKTTGGVIYRAYLQWIYGDTSATAGDLIFFSSAQIAPRIVTRVDTDASTSPSSYVINVNEPFNFVPTPGTHTYSLDDPTTLTLYTWSLYEKNVTDFQQPPGGI